MATRLNMVSKIGFKSIDFWHLHVSGYFWHWIIKWTENNLLKYNSTYCVHHNTYYSCNKLFFSRPDHTLVSSGFPNKFSFRKASMVSFTWYVIQLPNKNVKVQIFSINFLFSWWKIAIFFSLGTNIGKKWPFLWPKKSFYYKYFVHKCHKPYIFTICGVSSITFQHYMKIEVY